MDYDILGLPKSTDMHQVRKAYLNLSLKYHPDKLDEKSDDYQNNIDIYNNIVKSYNNIKEAEKVSKGKKNNNESSYFDLK